MLLQSIEDALASKTTSEEIETVVAESASVGSFTAPSELIELIGHRDRRVRRAAITHLSNLSLGTLPLSSDSADQLIALLSCPDWGVRCSALEALALHPASVIAPHAIRFVELLDHNDWGVRHVGLEAIELLEHASLEPMGPQLLARLPTLSWELRHRLCDCLVQLAPGSLSAAPAEVCAALPDELAAALEPQTARRKQQGGVPPPIQVVAECTRTHDTPSPLSPFLNWFDDVVHGRSGHGRRGDSGPANSARDGSRGYDNGCADPGCAETPQVSCDVAKTVGENKGPGTFHSTFSRNSSSATLLRPSPSSWSECSALSASDAVGDMASAAVDGGISCSPAECTWRPVYTVAGTSRTSAVRIPSADNSRQEQRAHWPSMPRSVPCSAQHVTDVLSKAASANGCETQPIVIPSPTLALCERAWG